MAQQLRELLEDKLSLLEQQIRDQDIAAQERYIAALEKRLRD
ncbi:MAG: hypothetical protein R2851_14240 [Caldilineaceae bacterium]